MSGAMEPPEDPQEIEKRKLVQSFITEPFVEDLTLIIERNYGPLKVAHLFGSLDSEKFRLLQAIGFECCARLPKHLSEDDAFYVSILKKIDPQAGCLRLGPTSQLVFRDEDINLVLGIPQFGTEVASQVSMEDVKNVKQILLLDPAQCRLSIGYIERLVTKKFSFPMTQAEEDAFKVAAVIHIMVNFMAVQGGSKRIPIEIFGSLVHPSRIKKVNWCGHVRRTLMAEAKKVQEQLKRGDKRIQPGGCSLYAKVHYLDNICLEDELQLSYRDSPRALLFTDKIMALAIRLDSIQTSVDGAREFGQSMMARESDGCYSRKSLPSGYVDSTVISGKRKAEEWIDFRENTRRKLTTDAFKRTIKISIIMQDRGSSKVEATRLGNLSVRGTTVVEVAHNDGIEISRGPISPFEIKFDHGDKPFHKYWPFYDKLKGGSVSRLESEWFIHREPTEIKITGWELRASLIPAGYFTMSVVDGVLRVYLCRDNNVYKLKSKRWRHFICATWTDAALHGYFGTNVFTQIKYFSGPTMKYDLRDCKLMPAPVLQDGSWSCYFWDFQEKHVIVLDPMMQQAKKKEIKKHHEEAVRILHEALFAVLQRIYPEWELYAEEWKSVYKNDVGARCKWGESGLYSVHYAYAFDGLVLTDSLAQGYEVNRRAKLIWDMLALWGNNGQVPPEFGLLMYKP